MTPCQTGDVDRAERRAGVARQWDTFVRQLLLSSAFGFYERQFYTNLSS